MTTTIDLRSDTLYWHFLKEDRRLQFGERQLVEVGQSVVNI